MERYNCTCHCGGSMFYKHLHDPSCDLFMHGEEAPQSKEAQLQAALDAERANRLAMEACVDRDVKAIKDLKAQLAALQAQLRQVEEALQERKEFIADCDTALDRIQAPRTNEGQEELVSTWRRIELLGKLLYQYRQELERSAPALRAENARLKEALQGMVKLVDDGLLVRSIANDHIAGWGIRALPIVQALQQAAFALQPVRDNHD